MTWMTLGQIGAIIVSPAVMLYIATMINKRIDDLKSKMDSDHANLAKMVEGVRQEVKDVRNHFDKRLDTPNQNFIDHLAHHNSSD